MSETKLSKRDAIEPFFDNVFQAIRTAGALLVGNSVLILVGIIGDGTNPLRDTTAVGAGGVFCIVFGSLTFTACRKIKTWWNERNTVKSNHHSDGDE